MIDNIKSSYFIINLFKYVDDRAKLKIIKYNKYMQNLIDINLIKYKNFSGKYIIFEDDGKGKEYNGYSNKLIFEGEYLNRKKNGKGKEYYSDGTLEFEGEYINGKRNGKGKEYHFEGGLIFEGEYFNGKRWNGKGYYNGKIGFEIKDGKGKIKECHNI